MDQRLYRLDQFYLWSRRQSEPELKLALKNYRTAVTLWNDNINRHLAMLQIFFGEAIREEFDNDVGADFVRVGDLAERFYRSETEQRSKHQAAIEQAAAILRGKVYNFNLRMLREIESRSTKMSAHVGILQDVTNIF